jgi:hypothetical protein
MASCLNLQLSLNGQKISEDWVLVACCREAEMPIERGW